MQIQIEVTAERIADLFVTAFEGATTYWCRSAVHVLREKIGTEKPWYADPVLYTGRFKIAVEFDSLEGGDTITRKLIGEDDVKRGLEIMATKYGRHFGNFLTENEDAETADVFLQCVVLGEIVFG